MGRRVIRPNAPHIHTFTHPPLLLPSVLVQREMTTGKSMGYPSTTAAPFPLASVSEPAYLGQSPQRKAGVGFLLKPFVIFSF